VRDAGVVPQRTPLALVDLGGLAEALDDHDEWTEWWFDPVSGHAVPAMDSSVTGLDDDLDTDDLVPIRPLPSHAAYMVMVEFADAVGDPRRRDLLQRALEGRGAFRRFRDTVSDVPELAERWREHARLAAECRALDWLADHDLVDSAELLAADQERRGRLTEILDLVADIGGPRFERDQVPEHWAAIAAHLDAGSDVVLTRHGAPWGTITRTVAGSHERG
jgi:hypothetical protein